MPSSRWGARDRQTPTSDIRSKSGDGTSMGVVELPDRIEADSSASIVVWQIVQPTQY
jgi:hypothetical protein